MNGVENVAWQIIMIVQLVSSLNVVLVDVFLVRFLGLVGS